MIALFLALAASAARPGEDSFITGADLLAQCQAKNELQLACNGYITGVSDAHGLYEAVLKKNSICYPDGTSISDISAAVIGFIASRPDHRGDGAAGLVISALLQRFPCGK